MKIYVRCRNEQNQVESIGCYDLSRVPIIGEKIVVDLTNQELYEVIDVHFADNQQTDVYVVKLHGRNA